MYDGNKILVVKGAIRLAPQPVLIARQVTISAHTQAERFKAACVSYESTHGVVVDDAFLNAQLAPMKISVGRSTLVKLRNPNYLVKDVARLQALASVLDAPVRLFFREEEPEPAMFAAERNLLEQMKASQVLDFAARTYGDSLSEADLSAVAAILSGVATRSA